jgi:outer membrane protein
MKKSLLAMFILLSAGLTHAESPWSIKVGASDVIAKGDGGTLAGFSASTSNDVQFTPSIEYAINPNLSAELLLATPFTHNVSLDGTKVASFKDLPPTLSLKYNFPSYSGIKPYFGLGLNYTLLWGEKTYGPLAGSKAHGDNSIGMAGLIGVQYDIPNTPYGVALDIRKVDIISKMKVNGTKVGDLVVDPWVIGIGGTYKF